MSESRKEYVAVVKVTQFYRIVVSAHDEDTAVEIAEDDAIEYGTPLDGSPESHMVSIALY